MRKLRIIFCLLGFLLNFIACYPGYMTGDSLDQYAQALSGSYTDWHPPAMAGWWSLLNHFYSGPQVMLVFQLVCLWLGLYFLSGTGRERKWYLVLALFAFAPFVQNFAGYIIKDSQMALAWFLAVAWMLRIHSRQNGWRWYELAICSLLLAYGYWIRINALPGFIPLCFLWAYTFFPAAKRITLAYGAGFLLLSSLAIPMINRVVLSAGVSYPEIKLYMHDLSGIFVRTGENVFPPLLYDNPDFDTGYIRKKYSVTSFDPIWWNNDGRHIIQKEDEITNGVLQNAWKSAIAKHTSIYLSNRWEGFLYYLRVKNSGTEFYSNINFIDDNGYGFTVSNNALHRLWQEGLKLHSKMPWMRPWFWLGLNLVLLVVVLRYPAVSYRKFALALLFSSLLYLLPMFFLFQVDYELRYSYWNCLSLALTCILLIKGKMQASVSPEKE